MASAASNLFPSLVDIAKKLDSNGNILPTVDFLSKKNAFLTDIAFKEGNLPTGHKFSARVALPSPQWRKLNAGVLPSKSQSDTYEETCGMLEGMSKVDCKLAELYGQGAAAFRADEDNAFASGFGLEVGNALFYSQLAPNVLAGYTGGPEKIQGLAIRYDGTGAAAAQLIRADASASGADQTSIWLAGWGPDTVYGIFPKGSIAGFKSEDLGKQVARDAAGGEYTVYQTHHKWELGLCVQDYRFVSRICNIDTSAWKNDAATGADLPMSMQDAIASIYDAQGCSPVFYMNRQSFAMFNKQLSKKSTNYLEYIERGGRLVPHFLGVPIRISDAIVNTEAVI